MVAPIVSVADQIPARATLLLADASDKTQPLLLRLDPEQRARVIMALLGLVLVGGLMMVLILAAGRRLRRIARQRHVRTTVDEAEWYRKPLVPPEATNSGKHEPE